MNRTGSWSGADSNMGELRSPVFRAPSLLGLFAAGYPDKPRNHLLLERQEDGARLPELLVDQGTADQFLDTQLKPALLEHTCARAGIPLTLRMHEGYDHSYFFISTFIEDHLRWHAQRLGIASA